MAKKLLVLFNGPPRSGKDTAAERVLSTGAGAQHIKLSAVLKNMTHDLYGINRNRKIPVTFDHFEDVKDKPRQEFYGLTPRDAYINVAERLLKPVHGDTFFAEVTLKEFHESKQNIVVVSDLGFQLEYNYFRRKLPADQILVVRVDRPGTDFSKDSREYVKSKFEHTYHLVNNSTLDKYNQQVEELTEYILKLVYEDAVV